MIKNNFFKDIGFLLKSIFDYIFLHTIHINAFFYSYLIYVGIVNKTGIWELIIMNSLSFITLTFQNKITSKTINKVIEDIGENIKSNNIKN